MHAFDADGSLKDLPFTQSCIGFADIDLNHVGKYKDMAGLYKKYMSSCPYVKYWLATGLDIDAIKKVYEEVPDIVGFGELKLYDDPNKVSKNYKSMSFLRQVMSFSEKVGNLPVCIHFEINDVQDSNKLEKILTDYPDIPLVLCHCGINKYNKEFAWNEALRLVYQYGNLYLDISWSGAKWLAANPLLITQLPINRCYWGSDMSPKLASMIESGEAQDFSRAELSKEYETINKYISSNNTIKKLFSR